MALQLRVPFITAAGSGCAKNITLPDVHEPREGLQIHVTDVTGHTILGHVKNVSGRSIKVLSLGFPIYDSDGNMAGEALANLFTGMGPGETWNFSAISTGLVYTIPPQKTKGGERTCC